jgi:peptide/nickel transport system substrate-binding protein
LVILVEALVEGLDPRYAVSGYGVKLSRLVAAPLVSVDTQDLSVKMELAREVKNPDPLTYIVTLKPEARFSNGQPVTAADVRATIESITAPKSYSPYRWIWKRVAEMKVLSKHTIRFVLKAPHSPFLTDLDIGILPATLVKNHPEPLSDRRIVGAGPFVIARRTERRITLTANPHFHRAPPRVKRVVIKTVQDDNSRLIMLAGGSADLTQNTIPALLLPAIRRYPKLKVLSGRSVTHTYVGLNTRHPILKKRAVRRALALALNRRTLIKTKLRGYAALASSILPAFHWAHNAAIKTYSYNPKKARRLLDRAGFARPTDGGPRFSLTYKTSNNPFRVSLARVMAHMWSQIGVKVEVRPYEWGVFYADIKKRNFELYTMQMTELVVPDYHYHFFHGVSAPGADLLQNRMQQAAWLLAHLSTMEGPQVAVARSRLADLAARRLPELLLRAAVGFRARTTGGGNRFGYQNPRVDWYLDAARRVTARSRQKYYYGRVQALLARDLPIIPLWHEDNLAVVQRNVCNYTLLPNARFSKLPTTYKSARCR